jgi:hypothetical protein
MKPGTGPGRGLPWWRWWRDPHTVWTIMRTHTFPEPVGFRREGRLLRRIGNGS